MSGFGDKMNVGDGLAIKLQCAHQFSGGEMRCQNCGEYYSPSLQLNQTEVQPLEFHDSLELLQS